MAVADIRVSPFPVVPLGESMSLWVGLYFSGPCNSFYCLGHFKNVYDDDDDDDDINRLPIIDLIECLL